ncbi:MAG: TIGR03960 family B12-binding radical SAM protein [Planctomycetota bacterium]|nr:MAG: TIGR03960 family B12-binding radical SAM protein [Planctomycetota bacterium]
MDLRSIISEELLPFVRQPGQYIGGEINQLVAPGAWKQAEVRVAIAFPDTYTIGMSHLGCQILYWLTNHTPGCCAERVFCPWVDAEAVMRRKRIPLFTWDTRQPVASADILAVSLQYEMAFSSVLQLLDLAGIPLRSRERDDRHPLVLAGGPQADNPEPMADFLDLVVLGDGEASMAAILEAYRELKRGGMRRREMIPVLAQRFPWLYAPSLYEPSYHADGTIRSVKPTDPSLPPVIERCQTESLEDAPFPVRPLVPYVEVVHDRIAIEIMRGCPQRCRFCHAGYTKRPLRLRSVDRILEMAEEMYRATGIEELGLLSLSTADYPDLRELAERVNERFAARHVNISVPSLRVDKMLQNIPWLVRSVRKSGLTMAVEAANDDMRAAIRKLVTDGNLLDGVREAYRAGWKSIKLYFMCGFPGERPEDIDGIVHLARQVSEARRELGKGPAGVNASVGWLVPKPYTPFQWAAQPEAAYFHEARRRMLDLLRDSGGRRGGAVRIRTHNVERSILEAVFARGDRRLSDAIERAYRLGARFDGWDECFRPDLWRQAFEETGIDPAWYAHRERSADEVFPWSHLHGGPPDDYLRRQYDDVFVQVGRPKPEPGLKLPILARAS